MNFREFRASAQDVSDLRDVPAVIAQMGDDSESPIAGRLYVGALYIELYKRQTHGDVYMLTIGNSSKFGTLESLERELFDFAITEGYIEAPTTEDELLEALRNLMDYVGGWDEKYPHPCAVARDLLARIDDQ